MSALLSAISGACTVVRAPSTAARAVGDRIAILLRAPTIAQVEQAALQGRTMPQKSTYFYPKTPDGFVIYDLDSCG